MRAALRILVWLLGAALFQAAAFGVSLLGGSLTYMGGADLNAIHTAWNSYARDIARLSGQMVLLDAVLLAALAVPFTPWFLSWWRRSVPGALGRALLLYAALRFTVIAIAAMRVPTLFSDLYYGDGTGLGARVMEQVCSRHGAILLALAWLGGLWLMARSTGWRAAGVAAAVVAVAGGWLWRAETRTTPIALPPGSVVVIFADSLRSDNVDPRWMPALTAAMKRQGATLIQTVIPPLPRTAPALASFMTGKLPEETGVTTMFSPPSSWKQSPSLASELGRHGLCTVAVGEYPAETMRKIDFGFAVNDTPLVRFREIALQLVLTKDPFALAALTFGPVRARVPEEERNLFDGLPIHADAHALLERLAAHVGACGGQPVFAFVFADQPHFPYVQTWPDYLELPAGYHGRYRYFKDAVSTPATDEDKARIRALYRASVRAVDRELARLVDELAGNGSLARSTLYISGDHGESLYDKLGIMGHGDQLGELEGIAVPWITFGLHRESFTDKTAVQSVRLAPRILGAAGVRSFIRTALPDHVIYLQTDAWLADTPNVPRERVVYPELSELLSVADKDAQIVLKPEYESVVEYAKHRTWVEGPDRWDLVPLVDHVVIRKNGAPAAELPPSFKDFLVAHDPEIAPLLLH